MATAEQVLAVARREIGYREGPNNANKYGAAYGMNNVAWCAIWIWWIFKEAGAGHLIHPKTAYTPTAYDWHRSRGQASTTPRVGDLVFYDWPPANRIQHVGIVEAVEPSAIVTIEGNTSSGTAGSQSDGGGVWRRRRARNSAIVGYAHPAYGAPASGSGGAAVNVLRKGSADERAIREAQTLLVAAGFPLGLVDGDFGRRTEGAVKAFQASRGLVVDGVIGEVTWKALRAAVAPSPTPRPAAPVSGDLTEQRIAAILTELTGSDQPGTFPGFATWGGGTDETLTAMAYHQRTNVEVRQAWLAVQRTETALRSEVAGLAKQVGELVAEVRSLRTGSPAAPTSGGSAQVYEFTGTATPKPSA
ncbi:MAG: CHAP domain-containing protein [Pseudonocardia sp.]|nr:CHAP domain-containing protein [Pseudonocardia sp.]